VHFLCSDFRRGCDHCSGGFVSVSGRQDKNKLPEWLDVACCVYLAVRLGRRTRNVCSLTPASANVLRNKLQPPVSCLPRLLLNSWLLVINHWASKTYAFKLSAAVAVGKGGRERAAKWLLTNGLGRLLTHLTPAGRLLWPLPLRRRSCPVR